MFRLSDTALKIVFISSVTLDIFSVSLTSSSVISLSNAPSVVVTYIEKRTTAKKVSLEKTPWIKL